MVHAEAAIAAGVVGMCVGSFGNVVAHRIPIGQTPWFPQRSYCPHCQSSIRFRDNIPLLSFFLLRGKCRDCHGPISWRYPVVEAVTALGFSLAFLLHGLSMRALSGSLFAAVLVVLATTDSEHGRLPTAVVASGAVLAAFVALARALSEGAGSLWHVASAALTGLGLLGLVRWVASRLARREAMGLGDVRLAGMMGLYIASPSHTLLAIVLASLAGALWGTVLIAMGRARMGNQMPFGPFLAVGGIVSFHAGEPILGWYLRLFAR